MQALGVGRRMKKIGRPRKSERKQNISVNLPEYLVDKINDQLSWKSSRSVWIEGAIKEKLGQYTPSVTEMALETMLFECLQRDNLDDNVKFSSSIIVSTLNI